MACTSLNGQRLRIWKAVLGEDAVDQRYAPGTIIAVNKEGIDIATGEGRLRLQLLQLPGGKVISAQDFINAHNVCGQRFTG